MSRKIILFLVFIFSFLFVFAVSSFLSDEFCKQNSEISVHKNEIVKWKKYAVLYPHYPDSWVKLAIVWRKSGRNELSNLAIKKAIRMDPINSRIKELEKTLAN